MGHRFLFARKPGWNRKQRPPTTQKGTTRMSVIDLIRQTEQTSDDSQAAALYREAIEQTGTVSETVKQQLKALIDDLCSAPNGVA